MVESTGILVLCPVRNEEHGLSKLIASMQSQTFTNWRMCITDNCSSDSGLNIIKEYSRNDSRISIFTNASPLGVGANWFQALTNGVNTIKAEFCMYIGGDDFLLENTFLQTLYELALSKKSNIIPAIRESPTASPMDLKISRNFLFNRLRLIREWRYIHGIHGLYRTEEMVESFSRLQGLYGSDFDWPLTFNLFGRRLTFTESASYIKTKKNLNYDSEYYTASASSKIETNNYSANTFWHFISGALQHWRTYSTHLVIRNSIEVPIYLGVSIVERLITQIFHKLNFRR